jgi:diguanylate cyclase (GGDEF)-like protein
MPDADQAQRIVSEISTISLLAASIAALLGLFLIITWLQERDTRALAWWGAAYLIGASSIALWSAPGPLLALPSAISGVLIFIACGMIWNGVRLFHGRKVLLSANISGAFVWLLVMQFPEFAADVNRSGTVAALIVAVYTFCIAFELWRERRKSLFSRSAALAVPLMHAAMFVAPITLKKFTLFGAGDGWLIIFALETMIYSVGAAFIVLMMVKDHHVRVQRDAASIDPLTGLLNRRAFFEHVNKLYERSRKSHTPVALLLFDLDKFKAINDTFGHAMGDEVLRLFAATLRSVMRADDIIARLGGEEVAAIIPGNEELAVRIAERVRLSFQRAGAVIRDEQIGATVSIGTACDAVCISGLEMLMARADAALYRAKSGGRNRVCAASESPKTPGAPDADTAKLAAGPHAPAAPIRTLALQTDA